MSSAPTYNDWKALRLAVLALVAAGVTGQPKAFLKALREAKAAALTLLFALARSLLPEDEPEPEPKPRRPAPLGRLSPLWRDHDEDAWRNPPAVAYRLDPRPIAPPKRGPPDPKRLEQRLAQGLQVLQRILSLCDDPDAHAMRLRRRLDELDAPLTAAEAKAFAVAARAEARRNHEARKLIDQSWRGRRRRDSG